MEEKKEVSRSELESPNRWIERMADLAGDSTVDRARIGEMIRREQAPVRTMRARATYAEGRESRLAQLAEAQRQRAHEPPGMETMRSVEIQPSGGSHYILVNGKEWSRHDSLKVAEQVRDQLIRDVWVARDQVVDQWYRQYEQAARDGGREEIQR